MKSLVLLAGLLPLAQAFPTFTIRLPNGRRVHTDQIPAEAAPSVGWVQGMNLYHDRKAEDWFVYALGHHDSVGGRARWNSFGEDFKTHGHGWQTPNPETGLTLCQADSDDDGYTNGEELGDPCCLWFYGDTEGEYTANFNPTHPAMAESHPSEHFDMALCGQAAYSPSVKAEPMGQLNDGEEVQRMHLTLNNYEVPKTRTTYVDMVWNLDESRCINGQLPMVRADVMKTHEASSKYLHHFVVSDCNAKFVDADGNPLPATEGGISITDAVRMNPANADVDCEFVDSPGVKGAWAPGAPILYMDKNTVDIWDCSRVKALKINVHWDNFNYEENVISNDGLYYDYLTNYDTVNLRNNILRTMFVQKISFNTHMLVPKQMDRYFYMRKCTIEVRNEDGTINNDYEVKIAQANLHAHLLGREGAIIKLDDENHSLIEEIWADEYWHFDDQYRALLGKHNMVLKNGDVIAGACGYNSMQRDYDTIFSIETSTEMCWTVLMYNAQAGDPDVICRTEGDVADMRNFVLPDDMPLTDAMVHYSDKIADAQPEMDYLVQAIHVSDYGTTYNSPSVLPTNVGTCLFGEEVQIYEKNRCLYAAECYKPVAKGGCCRPDGTFEPECWNENLCMSKALGQFCDVCWADVDDSGCSVEAQMRLTPASTGVQSATENRWTEDQEYSPPAMLAIVPAQAKNYMIGLDFFCSVMNSEAFLDILNSNLETGFGMDRAEDLVNLPGLVGLACGAERSPPEIMTLNKYSCSTGLQVVSDILDLMTSTIPAEDAMTLDCMMEAACPRDSTKYADPNWEGNTVGIVCTDPLTRCRVVSEDPSDCETATEPIADGEGGSDTGTDDSEPTDGDGSGNGSIAVATASALLAPLVALLI